MFKKILLSLFLLVMPALGQTLEQKHKQMLYPVVRVRAESVGGSGTVVYSKQHEGKWRTFVFTNFHVVDNLVEIKKIWDSLLGKEVQVETRKTALIEYFKYNNLSRNIGSFGVEADIVAYDKRQDWALLESRDQENPALYVAFLFPADKVDEEIHIMDSVHAVGASLGHAPIATQGHLTYLDDEIENHKYWMSTAQIIFGNSGGAMFRWSEKRERFEFIGIPSRIAVSISGFSVNPIEHMGFFIPIYRIYDLLDAQMFTFIHGKGTLEASEAARKQKRKEAEKK